MPDFSKALFIGKKVEQLFYNRLLKKEKLPYLIEGSFKPFDIYTAGDHTRWEVKCDMKSNYTGNYLIEVQHYGKPSALMTTKAEYWVYYDSKMWVVAEPIKIKELILKEGYKQIKSVGNGDEHHKLCYLIPKLDIIDISRWKLRVSDEEILDPQGETE